MAVDPVFASDRASLLKKLRMSTSVEDSSSDVIDEAILQVRTAIYQRLGADRVGEINSTSYSENASTEEEILRLSAAQIELHGVMARLMRNGPVFLLEAKNEAEEAWNDDDLLRNSTGDDRISYHEDLFLQGLDALVDDGVIDTTSIRAKTFGPSGGAKVIGRSIHNGKGLGGLY